MGNKITPYAAQNADFVKFSGREYKPEIVREVQKEKKSLSVILQCSAYFKHTFMYCATNFLVWFSLPAMAKKMNVFWLRL